MRPKAGKLGAELELTSHFHLELYVGRFSSVESSCSEFSDVLFSPPLLVKLEGTPKFLLPTIRPDSLFESGLK
jgi:hypothetical protein